VDKGTANQFAQAAEGGLFRDFNTLGLTPEQARKLVPEFVNNPGGTDQYAVSQDASHVVGTAGVFGLTGNDAAQLAGLSNFRENQWRDILDVNSSRDALNEAKRTGDYTKVQQQIIDRVQNFYQGTPEQKQQLLALLRSHVGQAPVPEVAGNL